MTAARCAGKVALVTGGNSGIGMAVAKGLVDEVTAAVLFLASDDASFITGADLLVDGGAGSF